MVDFPNILVIKVADAENFQGASANYAGFRYLKKHGENSGYEKYNLLPLGQGEKEAGKFAVYVPGARTFDEERAQKEWLVFMVATVKPRGKEVIAYYENAKLLEEMMERKDVGIGSDGGFYCYSILAPTAYEFKPRLKVENLKDLQSGSVMYIRENGKDRYPEAVKELLTLRKEAVYFRTLEDADISLPSEAEIEEGEFYSEGERKAFSHLRRERNPKLRQDFLNKFLKDNKALFCEECRFPKNAAFKGGEEILEVHHKIPLNRLPEHGGKTKLEDLGLLCPNCHRAKHKNLIPWR